ncbi:MAG: type II secretion system F family protein [Patescibacteria group bacterium]
MKTSKISLSINDKIGLFGNLATMLAAGISILEVVDSLLEDVKGGQKKILERLRADITQGKPIHESFSYFPNSFDRVTINIIKAAEQAGTLDTTLKDLKKHIQQEHEFIDKVKSALTYPVVIFVVFIGVMLMILIVVIPKIAVVFTRLHVELPLPTRILIFVSDLLIKNTFLFIAGIVAFVAIIFFIYKNNRKLLLNSIFSLPLVSQLVREIDLTRFTRSFALLLTSSIPIISALELTQDVVVQRDLAHVIQQTKDMVLSGKKISDGLKLAKGKIPSIMIKIIEAGEKTGSLDKSMQEISEHLDYQVSNTLRTLTALLEPVMLVLVGVLIGGMMLAIIAPIYGLVGQVGAR